VLSRRLATTTLPLLVGALALTACGSSKSETGTGSGGGGGSKTLSIGVIAPLSGDLSAVGSGIKNGVDLAIKQANAAGTVKGYTLKIAAEDDTAKADVGAQVATKLVSDASVVGVVGPLNSSVGKTVAPVMAQAGLSIISPSNSGIELTGRQALTTGGTQTRPYKSYFRVVASDDIQGPFAARYAVETVGAKKVAVVHDKKAYGQGLAAAFAAEAKKLGATVLTTETINPGDKDFGGVVSKIKAQNPDFLFYGGEYPEASLLTKQMKAAGLAIPLMGGDGVDSAEYIKSGGKATEGDFATALGAPTESLPSAAQFVKDYAAGGYSVDERDPYGAYAYDAANAIIKSLAKAVEGGATGDALRAKVLEGVQGISFDGATGPISFDQFGDTNSKVLTVYKVTGGKFVAAKTDSFK
jgi:branched-chain amino acid transport system substrate-binding protein